MTFDFPLPENLGNGRMHWAVKHRRKKEYEEILDNRLLVKMLPAPPVRPLANASAVAEVRTWRIMDRDGATSRCKWILDWLTTRGYIMDDSPTHLALDVTPVAVKRSELGVTLTLTEISPP